MVFHRKSSQYSVFEGPETSWLRGSVAAHARACSGYMLHFLFLYALPEARRAYRAALVVASLGRLLQPYGNRLRMNRALFDAKIVIGYRCLPRQAVRLANDAMVAIDRAGQEVAEPYPALLAKTLLSAVTASPSGPALPFATKLSAWQPDPLVANLLAIEQKILQVSIENFFQQQWMVWRRGPKDYQPILQEWFISMAHIFNLLDPPVSLGKDRDLMARLTHSLDQAVLDLLSQGRCRYFPAQGFSLNLHASSVLLPLFDRWMATIQPSSRPGLAIEIPVVDMIGDHLVFQQAIRKIRSYGCRIILDGVSMDVWSCLRDSVVTADWVKILWDGERAENTSSWVQNYYPMDRIILCRCDTQAAIEWGSQRGMRMFQGWRLDQKLQENNKK